MSFLRDFFISIVRRCTNGYSKVGSTEFGQINDRAFKEAFEAFLANVGKRSPDDFLKPGMTSRGNDFTLSRDTAREIVDVGEGRRYPVRNGHDGAKSPYYLRNYPGSRSQTPFDKLEDGKVTIEIKTSNFGEGNVNLYTLKDGLAKLGAVADRYIGVLLLFPLNSVCNAGRFMIDAFAKRYRLRVYVCSADSPNWQLISEAMRRADVDFARIFEAACTTGRRQETFEYSFAA